jgi:predicted acylesterase/phospholipase RssA
MVVMLVAVSVARAPLEPEAQEAPEIIVFSSGGIKGAAHAGVLVFMHEHGLMRRATKFAGSSAGAVIAAACALRMDVREIVRLWSELDYVALMTSSESREPKAGTQKVPYATGLGLGKYGGRAMHEFFRGFIGRETGEPDITFRGLHRARGTTLVVAVTCVSLRRAVYFTHTDEEYADTPVALALRMSCSLPLVLEPVWYKGLLFADGAIADPLPLTTALQVGGPQNAQALAVVVMSVEERPTEERPMEKRPVEERTERPKEGRSTEKGSVEKRPTEERPESPEEYAAMLLESAMLSRDTGQQASARVLYVRTDAGCGITRVQNEDTKALVRRGYDEARRFFLSRAGTE